MSPSRLAGCGVLAVVLVLTGCAAGAQGDGADAAGRYDDPFDLPLEQRFVDLELYGAAVNAFMGECMASAGWEYPVGTWDLSQEGVRSYSSLGYPNLAPDLVDAYGYRSAPDPREVVAPRDFSEVVPPDRQEEFDVAARSCVKESDAAVPDVAPPGNVFLQLNSKSRAATVGHPAVEAGIERWRQCVERARPPLGDPTDGPDGFRSSVLTAVDARDHPGEVDTMMLEAPPDEIEAARIDVECRQQSHYDSTYFSVIGEAQERLLVEKKDAIEKAEKTMGEIQQAIDHYVGEEQG